MAVTTRPNVSAMPTWVMVPPLTSLIVMAPVPANTSANVPNNSAASFLLMRFASSGFWLATLADDRRDLRCHCAQAFQVFAKQLVFLNAVLKALQMTFQFVSLRFGKSV